jgi:hypothetical protein
LAVKVEFASFPAAAAMLPGLLASGLVVEIAEAEYRDAVNLIPAPTPIPEGDTLPVLPSLPRFRR